MVGPSAAPSSSAPTGFSRGSGLISTGLRPRGIPESDVGAPPGVFRIMHGKSARFAFFHLGDGRVCWWCVRNAPEGPDGDALGGYEALTTFFHDWEPTVPALLAATPPAAIHRRDTF